jgi:hypothetical protein
MRRLIITLWDGDAPSPPPSPPPSPRGRRRRVPEPATKAERSAARRGRVHPPSRPLSPRPRLPAHPVRTLGGLRKPTHPDPAAQAPEGHWSRCTRTAIGAFAPREPSSGPEHRQDACATHGRPAVIGYGGAAQRLRVWMGSAATLLDGSGCRAARLGYSLGEGTGFGRERDPRDHAEVRPFRRRRRRRSGRGTCAGRGPPGADRREGPLHGSCAARSGPHHLLSLAGVAKAPRRVCLGSGWVTNMRVHTPDGLTGLGPCCILCL